MKAPVTKKKKIDLAINTIFSKNNFFFMKVTKLSVSTKCYFIHKQYQGGMVA